MSTKELRKNRFSIASQLITLQKEKDITAKQLSQSTGIELDTIHNYEHRHQIPPVENLRELCLYFGVSTDFLLLWNKTPYTHSIKLMNLAKQIDSGDYQHRFQVESTAGALIQGLENTNIETREDVIDVELTDSFHKNIKLLREKNEFSMRELGEKIGISKTQIYIYERKSIPRVDGLIKLSQLFNISIHALLTGEKLTYDFKDQHLEETILKADKLLSLRDKDFLIHLMEKIIENSK